MILDKTYLSEDFMNIITEYKNTFAHKFNLYFGFLIFMIIGTALSIPVSLFQDPDNPAILPYLVTTLIAEFIILFLGLLFTGHLKNWKVFLLLDKPKFSHFAIGIFAGPAIFITLQVTNILINNFIGEEGSTSSTTSSIADSSGIMRVLLFFILVPIIIPFVEEVFFRAFLINSALYGIKNRKLAIFLGVLLSSFFFALAHVQGFSSVGDLMVPLNIFFVGMVNALLLVKTNSVWTSFMSHATYNGITLLVVSLIAANS